MKREEEIVQASVRFNAERNMLNVIGGSAILQKKSLRFNKNPSFIAGATWADENPKKGLINVDRACEWLECNAACYLNSISASDNPTSLSTPRYIGAWLETDRLIEDFKKAMQL